MIGHSVYYTDSAAQIIADLNEKGLEYDVIFLDHDLGGETFVSSQREDCGMEVVRHLEKNPDLVNSRTLIVVHSLNIHAGLEMVSKLLNAGFYNTFYVPFTRMAQSGGPNLQINP